MLGARQTIEHLRDLGALDERVSPADAADTLAAISDVRCALVLLDSYGWTIDHIEDWIAATSRRALLRLD